MTAVAQLDRRFVVAHLRANNGLGGRARTSGTKSSALERGRDALWIVEQHNATFRFEYERMMRNERKALLRQAEGDSGRNVDASQCVAPLPRHFFSIFCTILSG